MGKATVMTNDNGEFDVNPTESETTSTVGNFSHGSRETPVTSVASGSGSVGEGVMPHVRHVRYRGVRQPHSTEEADEQRRVPRPAESVEGRGLAKENTRQLLLDRTQRRNADGFPFVPGRAGCLVYGRQNGGHRRSEVRAVCGKAARTDLRGGWPERAIPTAIVVSGGDREQH